MSRENFTAELNYQITASIARTTLKRRLIRKNEIPVILNRLIAIFRPIIGRFMRK